MLEGSESESITPLVTDLDCKDIIYLLLRAVTVSIFVYMSPIKLYVELFYWSIVKQAGLAEDRFGRKKN